jgi:hypothetical protein
MYGTLPPFGRYEWGNNIPLNVHLFDWSGKTLYHSGHLRCSRNLAFKRVYTKD